MVDYLSRFSETLGGYAGVTFSSYVTAVLILILFFILAKLINFVIDSILMKLAAKTNNDIDDRMIKIVDMPIFYSVVFFGVYKSFSHIDILGDYVLYFSSGIETIVVILWAFAISKLARVFIEEVGFKFAAKTKSTLDDEMMPLFKNLSNIIIWFAAIMFVFKIWNIDITPLLASAGIAGFVVAFAAQDTISHLFGGVSIYFDKPFKVGDRIQLESGEIGDVLEIGVRSTRIKTFDETVVIMPNSVIAGSKIINFNQPQAKIKVKIKLNLAYNTDVQKVENLLKSLVKETKNVEVTPEPSVYLSDFGDYHLKFLIILWVDSPTKQFSVKTDLNKRILETFRKEGISMPYPSQDIYIKENK